MRYLPASAAGRILTLAAGAATAATAAGYLVRLAPLELPALAAAAALVALATLPRSRRLRTLLVALGFACFGLARGASGIPGYGPATVAGHLVDRNVALTGTVRTAPIGSGGSLIIDAQHLTSADSDAAVSGGVLVTAATAPAVAPGDLVEVDASGLRAPDRRPGPQSEAILEREDVEAVTVSPLVTVDEHGGPSLSRAVAAVQTRLVQAVNAVLPQPAAPLLLGVAFGIHQPFASDARASLQDAGLIHIVVVSGLKVIILLGLVAAVANARQWPVRRTLLVATVVVAGYVLVSGAGPAAVRSALMGGVAMLIRSRGRRVDPIPLLASVAAAMLLVDPRVVEDPGFQLSFLGTAGILLLAEPLARRIRGPRILVDSFSVTVAAQVATAPVMAGTFGVLSFVAPLANALVLPALPAMIVLGGGGALLSAIWAPLGWLPLQLAAVGANIAMVIAQLLTKVPLTFVQVSGWPLLWTAVELTAIAIVVVLFTIVRTRRRQHSAGVVRPRHRAVVLLASAAVPALGILVAVVAARSAGGMQATVLDVGSASAVLVQTPDGSRALVDGGASQAQLQQALGRVLPPLTRGIGMVVVTDGKQAAVAGLAGLPGHYDVPLVMAPGELTPGAAKVVEALQASGADVLDDFGRAWNWGGAGWRCLGYRAEASGAAMCALTIDGEGSHVLVLGDAASSDQEDLGAMYGTLLHADVLVAPPGGAVAVSLVRASRAAFMAVPVAKGTAVHVTVDGVRMDETGVDGDLNFAAGASGMVETT